MADEGQGTQTTQDGQGADGAQIAGDQQDASGAAAGQTAQGAQQSDAADSGSGSSTPEGQTQGQSSAGEGAQEGRSGSDGDGGRPAAGQGSTRTQSSGYRLSLTEDQRKRLLDEGMLEISEDQYTSGVRHQMESLRRRATSAEKKLGDIAAAQEEAERKALEEQERYKDLYEKEREARESETSAHREDLIRSRFLLAAQSKGIVDPDVAFVIAKGLPEFEGVKLADEGSVAGIDAVLESLIEGKPYLISQTDKKPQRVGAASNPAQQSPPPPKNLAEAGDRLEQALRTGVS